VEDPGIAWNASFGTSENISGIHPILEMKVPLALIGVNGSEGGTVGFQFIYMASEACTYLNAWPTYAWTGDPDNPTPIEESIKVWGDLMIPEWGGEVTPPPPPEEGEGIPVWVYAAVAVVVIVVVVVAVFMLRRR